ncbi:hypothetical protein BDD12DRAFT_857432 [Trichophaea hybrida]|nr:hypothetical protein BDD12DRAFT_857432 [Trichophaea hybrida]
MCATDKRPWRGIFAFSVTGMMGLNPLSLVMAEVKRRWCKGATARWSTSAGAEDIKRQRNGKRREVACTTKSLISMSVSGTSLMAHPG